MARAPLSDGVPSSHVYIQHAAPKGRFGSSRETDSMPGVPSQSLAALQALRSKIFGTTYNPTNARTGAKYLKKALVGGPMLNYYPPQVKLSSIVHQLPSMPRLMAPDEVQRFIDVKRKKMLGKGPPKKGTFFTGNTCLT